MSYRLGVVGGGMYGSTLCAVFHSLTKAGAVRFCALADLSAAVRERAAADYGVAVYEDYREMIARERLDAVAIVTPDHLHEEMAVYAAEKHLHLLVQKPLDTTTEGARRIVKAARENDVLLYVDFHKRFDPSFALLRRNLQDGRLGEPLYGYVNIEDVIDIPSVSFKSWAHRSSPAWFIGVHMADLLCWALGEAPVSVLATGQKKKLASMGIDAYDAIQAKLLYAGGASISLDASWVLPSRFPSVVNQNLRLVGAEGVMEIDGQHRGVEAWCTDGAAAVPNPYGFLNQANPVTGNCFQGYTIQSLEYFVKLLGLLEQGASLQSLAGTYPCGEEAVRATRVVEAIHESLASGAAVAV